MIIQNLLPRMRVRFQRECARFFFRRAVKMKNRDPLISFTFDDFPRSAILSGGSILKNYGARGTYFAALSLMGKQTEVGEIFSRADLEALLEEKHELGSHTFGHYHSWNTRPSVFESSIIENNQKLSDLSVAGVFRTFSYPISDPKPRTKRNTGRHFECCRCGGQMINARSADLNWLSAFFLERSRDDLQAVKRIIDENAEARGWLIFATHDICEHPTRYGCSPEFFEEVVRYAARSGSRIVTVADGCDAIRGISELRSNNFHQKCS